jgi:SAM-dependent methyltransferase
MNRFQGIDPDLLKVRPNGRLLDVGCGVGRHVLELSRLFPLSVGVDWARYDLLKGAYWFHLMQLEGGANGCVNFMQGDGSRLPFADSSFDRVVCTEVFEHVSHDRDVMAELVRVLRPGGVIAVSVPDELSERLLWRLSPHYRLAPGGHIRIYSRRAIRQLLTDGGLRPFAVQFRHSLEATYWIAGALLPARLGGQHPLLTRLRAALSSQQPGLSAILDFCDRLGNHLLPKSIVLYARKPAEAGS